MAAVALIVIDVDTRSSGIPSNRSAMSSTDAMETPTLPTSPNAIAESGSWPIWVGRSKATLDRKSTRLNSSHSQISYAVFCLKKKQSQADPDRHVHVAAAHN